MDDLPPAVPTGPLETRRRDARKAVAAEKEGLAAARRTACDLIEAQQLVQKVAAAVQENAHRNLAAVVTRALEAVGYDYEFRFRFERKRGKTEAKPVFVRDGQEIDPLRGSGLGPVDVAAFALRVAAVVFQRPARRRLVVLDEPFKHVSARGGYRARVRAMVEAVSKETGVQIIMVTHADELVCGKVIDLGESPPASGG